METKEERKKRSKFEVGNDVVWRNDYACSWSLLLVGRCFGNCVSNLLFIASNSVGKKFI